MTRRWFQFRLSWLLIAVTCISVWLGVWVHRSRRQRDAITALRNADDGVSIEYDFEDARPNSTSGILPPPRPPGPNWLRELAGIDFVADVVRVNTFGWQLSNGSAFTDADANLLGAFPKLKHLRLDQVDVTDRGLDRVAKLHALETLYLRHLPVTDAGIERLTGLPGLNFCVLDCHSVTETGLKHLSKLPALRFLDLRTTPVTDAGLLRLAASQSLREIIVSGDQLTPAGIAAFRQAAPACKLSVRPASVSRN